MRQGVATIARNLKRMRWGLQASVNLSTEGAAVEFDPMLGVDQIISASSRRVYDVARGVFTWTCGHWRRRDAARLEMGAQEAEASLRRTQT